MHPRLAAAVYRSRASIRISFMDIMSLVSIDAQPSKDFHVRGKHDLGQFTTHLSGFTLNFNTLRDKTQA